MSDELEVAVNDTIRMTSALCALSSYLKTHEETASIVHVRDALVEVATTALYAVEEAASDLRRQLVIAHSEWGKHGA